MRRCVAPARFNEPETFQPPSKSPAISVFPSSSCKTRFVVNGDCGRLAESPLQGLIGIERVYSNVNLKKVLTLSKCPDLRKRYLLMNLDTFFTTLYCLVDDWCKSCRVCSRNKARSGPPLRMSDSEVLTLVIAAQWRVGVPWRSSAACCAICESTVSGFRRCCNKANSISERTGLASACFVAASIGTYAG